MAVKKSKHRARKKKHNVVSAVESKVQVYLNDHLLHKVFSSLDQIDLCRAAHVCKQWRDATYHQDFWRSLNFQNLPISAQQIVNMCQRFPNATAVNAYDTGSINSLGIQSVNLLGNLESLTLGKGRLRLNFFQALTDCHTLRSLTINDATLRNRREGVPVHHDTLHHLQIVNCRVFSVSIKCPQLETLSLKCSNMTDAVLGCPLLRDLDIATCRRLSNDAIRSAATSCPLLESLDISDCPRVTDHELLGIASSCQNLNILDASYCPFISLGSVTLSMLTVLKLHECWGITSASMADVARSPMLEVLELDNCIILDSVSLDLPCLQSTRLVRCHSLVHLNLRCTALSSITVSNCPALRTISITSNALRCYCLQEVDLTECESLKNCSICDVSSSGGFCHALRSLVLDSCKSLTAVTLCSMSLVSLSLGGCHSLTSLDLSCPCLENFSIDGCNYLERVKFSPVGLRSLILGICPKLSVLHIEAPEMVSLELKACGVLSEALIKCPLLKSLHASFCIQFTDDCLSAIVSSCPLIESLVLMSCPSVGTDGLAFLHCLRGLTFLDLSYTFLVHLQPVFHSCVHLKVLILQACKYLGDSSLEPLYKHNALPALCELDLSYVTTLCQSTIEELLACGRHLTHVSLNGCVNLHDVDWSSQIEKSTLTSTFNGSRSSKKKKKKKHSTLQNIVPSKEQGDRLLKSLNCVSCPNIKKVVIPAAARCIHLSLLNFSLSSNLKEVDITCSNLVTLNLSNCNSLAILKLNCPRLTTLSLQFSGIDEQAVEAAISQCNMLETLDVRCPKISPSSIETLRTACPSLKHIFSSLPTAPISGDSFSCFEL
ncbi:F-box/LRR-repeat protein 15 [Salvia divinorum]|uniref:F-box/LRR-repeat protein 15 n=1 Tax=Salvia divinorum TaxID=28513 RepID=A0ABD1I1K8_SALDI